MGLPGSNAADALKQLVDPRTFGRSFLILLAIFSIFYFSELANFSLSVDDEIAMVGRDPAIWAAQERWLNYLIERFVIRQPILPFFPLFLFGGLASLGYIIVAKAHRYALDEGRMLLAFILFAAFPVLYFIIDFSVALVSIGIGIVLSCICLALFERALHAFAAPGTPRGAIFGLFAMQAALGAAAIGIYQSLILLVAAGCCGLFLLRYLRGPAMSARDILLVHGYLACGIAASVILSALIARGFQWALDIQPRYIGHFVRLDRLAEAPLAVIRKLAREYWVVYGGKRAVYGFRYVTFPALLALGMFALAALAPRRKAKTILFIALYMIAITAIPFAIHPLAGGKLPFRTLVAVPYVFWFFAAAALSSHSAAVRRLAVALVVVVSIQCLYTFSDFQAQKRMVLDHDKLLASELYQRIVGRIPDFDRSKTYRVEVRGAREFESVYREIRSSTYSLSFFEFAGGRADRIVAFMNILGYSNLVAVDETEHPRWLPLLREMPVWPAAGSVQFVDDTILVRLGRKRGDGR